MNRRRSRLLGFAMLGITGMAHAQNDGDHLITNLGGQSSLATDLQVPVAPVNLTVGTTPGLGATLRVRGDQLVVPDLDPLQASMRCTFRTDVLSGAPQSWRMYRDVNRIGAIWNEGNHRVWHVQALENRDVGQDRYSGLMLQNDASDGIWVMNAGGPTGARAFPVPATQVLDAVGYAGLGSRPPMLPGGTSPRGPWSRLHLFHDVMGTRPEFAFRPQMLNGITLTGNSDLAYMGQWFDHGTSGTGPEVDDRSNLVIATSENALAPGNTYWDNISFRYFGNLTTTADGSASTVGGLEMMRIQPYRATAADPIQGLVLVIG